MDTLGFGASVSPPEPASIELFAEGVIELCAALGLASVDLAGHHTGGVVAVEVAAARPDLVRSLVLSGTPFVDPARRRRVAVRPPIDEVDGPVDGTSFTLHLSGHRTNDDTPTGVVATNPGTTRTVKN
jgi:pimeloyl-ACP methyl ester carboxylesterase